MRTVLDEIQTAVDHFGYVTLRQADVDRVHALLLKGSSDARPSPMRWSSFSRS